MGAYYSHWHARVLGSWLALKKIRVQTRKRKHGKTVMGLGQPCRIEQTMHVPEHTGIILVGVDLRVRFLLCVLFKGRSAV